MIAGPSSYFCAAAFTLSESAFETLSQQLWLELSCGQHVTRAHWACTSLLTASTLRRPSAVTGATRIFAHARTQQIPRQHCDILSVEWPCVDCSAALLIDPTYGRLIQFAHASTARVMR